jgi:hypothetical protein
MITATLLPMNPEDFSCCEVCTEDRLNCLCLGEELLRRREPLRGLELFSGMVIHPGVTIVTLHISVQVLVVLGQG